jgi:prepilin-type N-terminal cleavage/methylation domain-containing protein
VNPVKKINNRKAFSIVEIMLVLVVIGVMSAIAVPQFIKRLHGQRLSSASNQVLTHLRQARSRAIKTRKFYRLNFKYYKNAYFFETCETLSLNDDDWQSEFLLGQEKEEEKEETSEDAPDDINMDHIIFLPKDVRIDDNSNMEIIFTPKGNLDPGCLPAEITLVSLADDDREVTLGLNLSGIPRVVEGGN